MESIINQIKRKLREAGPPAWPAIATAASAGLPKDQRIGLALLRKLAYGDRRNPGVQTIQPLVDYFAVVEQRGDRAPTKPSKRANARGPVV